MKYAAIERTRDYRNWPRHEFLCQDCAWLGDAEDCHQVYYPGSSAAAYYGPEPDECFLYCPVCRREPAVGSFLAPLNLNRRFTLRLRSF